MAANDLLSQDEIDALLHGVDSGDVSTEDDVEKYDGVARSFDFASQDRFASACSTCCAAPLNSRSAACR